MDLTAMIAPRSDQKNADDFLAGPRTFTITADVEYESKEQPFGLVLDGDTAHPYKPCKSMGRVLVAAWGPESSAYIGRRLTLYTDPSIKFGGQDVGGIRISAMSHITKPLKLALTLTKGKKGAFVVQPLTEAAVKGPRNSAQNSEPAADRPTPEQMRAVADGLTAAHITDGPGKAQFIAETIGRPMNGWDDLTAADAVLVIDALKAVTA